MEHTRDIWVVHMDVSALGGAERAKDNVLHLLADHTLVRTDAVDVYVGEESVMVKLNCELEAKDIVDHLQYMVTPCRRWLEVHGTTVFASLVREELEWVEGLGPVWVQKTPGRPFKIIRPDSCVY